MCCEEKKIIIIVMIVNIISYIDIKRLIDPFKKSF